MYGRVDREAGLADPHPVTASVCAYEGQPALLESAKHTDVAGNAPGLAEFLNRTRKVTGAHPDCVAGTYPTGIDADPGCFFGPNVDSKPR